MHREQAWKMLHKTFKFSVNEKGGDLSLDFPSCKAPPQTLNPPIPTEHRPKLGQSHPAGMHSIFSSHIGGCL